MASDDYRWHYDYTRLAWDLGFTFQINRAKPSLDKNIGHVDIEQVIKDRDIPTIEKHIGTIIEFTLDNDQTSVLDPTFVKLFRISQLAVQYLLFCKKYLDNTVVLIKQEFIKNNEETKNLKRHVDELRQDAANSKKQIKELKSALSCQIASTQNIPVFQCNECPKAFSTEEYLLAHIKRRHETIANIATAGTSLQAETDKLQLEIKQLKERLNNTEKFIHFDDSNKPRNDFIVMPNYTVKDNVGENTLLADLQQKFELLKTHVENELQILQTQKFDQEKYEKWFETFLSKLEQSQNVETVFASGDTKAELGTASQAVCKKCLAKANLNEDEESEEKKDDTVAAEDKVSKNDNTTQTDFMLTPQQARKVIERIPIDPPRRNSLSTYVNIPQKSHSDTDHRLEKFEEKLQEKVSMILDMVIGKAVACMEMFEKLTGSMEMLETQMQSFWSKMNEIEKQKSFTVESSPITQLPRSKSNTSVETIEIKPQKVVPKPRKKIYSRKEAFNSPPPEAMPNQRIIKINAKPVEIKKTTTVTLPKNALIESVTVNKVGTNFTDSDSNSDTESDTSEDSNSSGSESETDNKRSDAIKPIAKPSLTSTLGQRSLTSLKAAAFTPEVLQGLQKEVENILNSRLEELGVSPNWLTLPTRSYQRALGIVTHQATLIQKNVANYKHIRSLILKDVNKQVLEQRKNGSLRKDSKLMTLFSNVKNKAKVVMSNESDQSNKRVRNIGSTPLKIQKTKLHKAEAVQNLNIKSNTRMYSTDSESDNPIKNKRSNVWNQSKITDQTHKAYDNVIQELNTTVNTKIRQQESPEASPETNRPVVQPRQLKTMKKDESEDDSHSDVRVEVHSKGVLKTYPSTSSLHKKKVLFDLESLDVSSPKKTQNPVVPTVTNEGGSTTSVASSVFDGPKPDPMGETVEKKQELSDISDWDLSEILD